MGYRDNTIAKFVIIIQINYTIIVIFNNFHNLGQNKLGVLLTELRQKLRIPTASSTPIYNPVNIQHTDSHPYSSSDDNTTQQRIIKGYDSYTNKRYSFPPKQGNTYNQ